MKAINMTLENNEVFEDLWNDINKKRILAGPLEVPVVELTDVKKAIEKYKMNSEWVPVSVRNPEIAGEYEVTFTGKSAEQYGKHGFAHWLPVTQVWYCEDTTENEEVVAWREPLEPYEEV